MKQRKKQRLGWVSALLCAVTITSHAGCPPPGRGHLAIIIDDLGYNLARGEAVARLPSPVTLAIIPKTPHALHLAELGQQRGKEIIVHMPMSSAHSQVSDPLALTENLTPEAFDIVVDEALERVPGATGMNNHMGSALTENRAAMDRFMQRLKSHDLFFIDSRTSAETVAADAARALDVATASRSVFLDNERDRRLIRQHLERAVEMARNTGSAIAIGHPYPETVEVLTDALVRLPADITLTRASTIARCEHSQRLTSIP